MNESTIAALTNRVTKLEQMAVSEDIKKTSPLVQPFAKLIVDFNSLKLTAEAEREGYQKQIRELTAIIGKQTEQIDAQEKRINHNYDELCKICETAGAYTAFGRHMSHNIIEAIYKLRPNNCDKVHAEPMDVNPKMFTIDGVEYIPRQWNLEEQVAQHRERCALRTQISNLEAKLAAVKQAEDGD